MAAIEKKAAENLERSRLQFRLQVFQKRQARPRHGNPQIPWGFEGRTPMTLARLRRRRKRLEDAIEKAIALLDEIDGDADIEDGADDEPSLGWTGSGHPRVL
jgi:hypothetical protein